jgi:serine/threonine protein kinase
VSPSGSGRHAHREARPPGTLEVGDLLADRYRLLEDVPTDGPAVLWRAHDEVLARLVAVKCLPTPNKAARDEAQVLLDAAVRTGAVNHPGLARIYDAALEPRPGRGNDVAYVIGEWVEGEPLDTHLQRVGAVAALDAADVLRQAADALTAAHAAGLAHGRVHPGNVLITTSGRVRLTDTHVAAALRGTGPGSVADDTRDLAAVLYALLTRRWPSGATPQPAGALQTAPREGGHVLTARQLRAGVSRELDHVVTRGLEPTRLPTLSPLRTPAALADAADASVATERAEEASEEAGEPTAPGRLRRSLPWLVAAAVVGTVGVLGWTLGLAVGDLPGRPGSEPIVSTSDVPTPGVRTFPPISLARAAVSDFDPLGKDHQESPNQVSNAYDEDASTAWVTQSYRTADFSGLKSGVGLLLDLRTTTALHSVQVAFSAPGARVEVRVSDTAPAGPEDARLVAGDDHGDQVATMRPVSGTRARYVLVWITHLPKDGKTYRVGVSELRLT